jgi:hypothetical protein
VIVEIPLPGRVRPALPCLPIRAHSSSVARTAPADWAADVGRDPFPREVAPQRERGADDRIKVRAGHGAHEQDDRRDHQAWRGHPGGGGHGVAAEPGVDHPAPDRDEDEEERAEHLGEQPPPFVAAVGEVELAGDRVRLAHRPQGDIGAAQRRLPLPGRLARPGRSLGRAGHRCLSLPLRGRGHR